MRRFLKYLLFTLLHTYVYRSRRVCGSIKPLLRVLLLLLVLQAGCRPEPLEVTGIPEADPEIVVATQMLSEQSMVVWLSRTFGALEAKEGLEAEGLLKQIAVNDALVTITGPAGTDTLIFEGNGVYRGLGISLEAGRSYDLMVDSETMGVVYASSIVLPQVAFETLEPELFYGNEEKTAFVLKYSFPDDPEEQNFYMLNIQNIKEEELYLNRINPEALTILLEDTEFNGETYAAMVDFPAGAYEEGDTLAVSLANISKAYFHFMEERTGKRIGLLEFLSEPVNYPSNVIGGKGFFNLYVPDVRVFVVQGDD